MADEDEAAEVRQIWSALGLPGVIDVHTHFMPKSVMDKVWHYFDSAGPLVGREWPITYRSAESERLQTLRRFGVRGFTALVYPHKPRMAAWLNQWAVQFARSAPDCLATATFYPEPDAGDYVEAAIHDGPYNYYKNGDYAGLVDAFNAGDGAGLGLPAATAGELADAIRTARAHEGGPVLIECQIPNDDASPELISWGSKVAGVNGRLDPRFH